MKRWIHGDTDDVIFEDDLFVGAYPSGPNQTIIDVQVLDTSRGSPLVLSYTVDLPFAQVAPKLMEDL